METLDQMMLEPNYAESVRRYNARQEDAHRWQWVRFFDKMARLHGDLAASYEARAQALIEDPHDTPARVELGASLTPLGGSQSPIEGSYKA